MPQAKTLFKATVPNAVLHKPGLSPEDACNLMLAQIAIHKAPLSLKPKPQLSAEEQADEWTQAYGAY